MSSSTKVFLYPQIKPDLCQLASLLTGKWSRILTSGRVLVLPRSVVGDSHNMQQPPRCFTLSIAKLSTPPDTIRGSQDRCTKLSETQLLLLSLLSIYLRQACSTIEAVGVYLVASHCVDHIHRGHIYLFEAVSIRFTPLRPQWPASWPSLMRRRLRQVG